MLLPAPYGTGLEPMALPEPSDASTALITGASAGIGEAIARELARRGHGVTLVARREARLRSLAGELSDELGVDVEILVNNAGFGGGEDFTRAERERLVGMVTVNCLALLDLQAVYLPQM